MSILNIDDDENDILLLRSALKGVGYDGEVAFASDGQEAIEYLDRVADPETLDLILLDLKMPRRNGFECLQWLRSREEFRKLPVAIFTTSSHPDEVRKAYDLGADLFLVKPLTYDELLEIARALGTEVQSGSRKFPLLRKTSAFRPKT